MMELAQLALLLLIGVLGLGLLAWTRSTQAGARHRQLANLRAPHSPARVAYSRRNRSASPLPRPQVETQY